MNTPNQPTYGCILYFEELTPVTKNTSKLHENIQVLKDTRSSEDDLINSLKYLPTLILPVFKYEYIKPSIKAGELLKKTIK